MPAHATLRRFHVDLAVPRSLELGGLAQHTHPVPELLHFWTIAALFLWSFVRSLSVWDSFWTVIGAPASDLRAAKLMCPSRPKSTRVVCKWSTAHDAVSRSFELFHWLFWCRKEPCHKSEGCKKHEARLQHYTVWVWCLAWTHTFDHTSNNCFILFLKIFLSDIVPSTFYLFIFLISDCFQTDKNGKANKIKVPPVVVERTHGICLNQIAGRHLHSEGNCWKMSHRINRFW